MQIPFNSLLRGELLESCSLGPTQQEIFTKYSPWNVWITEILESLFENLPKKNLGEKWHFNASQTIYTLTSKRFASNAPTGLERSRKEEGTFKSKVSDV